MKSFFDNVLELPFNVIQHAHTDRARKMGLQGYVVKGDSEEIESAMHELVRGKTHFQKLG